MLLKDSIQVFVEGARVNFHQHQHIAPTVAINLDGSIKISPLDFANDESKDAAAEVIKDLIAHGRVTEFLIVAESWLAATGESGRVHEIREWIKKHGTLQNYPDRREAVLVVYSNPEEEITYTAYIDRIDHQAPTLGDWSMSIRKVSVDPALMSSRFDSLFIKGSSRHN